MMDDVDDDDVLLCVLCRLIDEYDESTKWMTVINGCGCFAFGGLGPRWGDSDSGSGDDNWL